MSTVTNPSTVPAAEPSSSTTPDEPVVYTIEETARLLRLSLGGTYALARSGGIPARKLGGRWVVPKHRFHAWLAAENGDEEAVPAR